MINSNVNYATLVVVYLIINSVVVAITAFSVLQYCRNSNVYTAVPRVMLQSEIILRLILLFKFWTICIFAMTRMVNHSVNQTEHENCYFVVKIKVLLAIF